ncbi:cysteine desulfurase-like protein [Vibrio sp.]|nr:cysteine desulfurase-like protein [Vibrio sp.]
MTKPFELTTVRDQFGAFMTSDEACPIFFDGPGGSQVPHSVTKAMGNYLGYGNSNLGGHFPASRDTNTLVDKARLYAQSFLNAPDPSNIVFGANMTSLTFHLSRIISRQWDHNSEVIVTQLDHYANVSTWEEAAQDKGATVHHANIHTDTGSLDIEHTLSLINANTTLVALTYASNTTGSIVDVQPIIEKAHHYHAMVYIDAVHYAPHHLIDVQAIQCDFLVCSAYKFYGPHLGIAYISPQWCQQLTPYKVAPAPDSSPNRFETGTLNFEALAGFIATLDYLSQWGQFHTLRERLIESFSLIEEHEEALSDYFLDKLKHYPNIALIGHPSSHRSLRTPTFALCFANQHPEVLAKALGEHQICVWNGHFYAIGLIKKLGLENKGGVLRVGLMHYNTKDEIDTFFRVLDRSIETM